MTADQQPSDMPLISAFLNDFYTESDEHLASLRQSLLALELCLPTGYADRPLLDELFRSFHSLKSLVGMAGLADAEQIAHQLETILRRLRQGDEPLTAAIFDALMIGTRALDQVLTAYRSQAPAPDLVATIERLTALTSMSPPPLRTASITPPADPAVLSADEQAQLEAVQSRSLPLWVVEFTPSPALSERGINVNTVRARLQSLGTVVRVTPKVGGTGGISFAFILAAELDPATQTEVTSDGMALSSYSPPLRPDSPMLPAATGSSHGITAQVVRVDLERLDELLQQVGELVIMRARLTNQLDQIEPLIPRAEWRALQETNQLLGRRLRDLRTGVVRVRMVPVGEAFARMQFASRDLARELGKQVVVDLRGQQTEIDKYLIERMLDPLLHLVRNAVSHGIERQEERLAAGKPAMGTITLCATTVGDSVLIEIGDDGQGIDLSRVMARARDLHLLAQDALLGPDGLLDLLCLPGFSTRVEADRVSGRGVGLDVVRTAVRELNGTLALQTTVGRGTTFQITLPLTLLVVDALLASVGQQVFAIPLTRVHEVVEIDPNHVTTVEGHELTLHRGKVLPLLRLAQRFRLKEIAEGGRYAFVVSDNKANQELVGVVVDQLIGKREIVVRPIADSLGRSPGISGATELGDGRPVLIIDVPGLFTRAG